MNILCEQEMEPKTNDSRPGGIVEGIGDSLSRLEGIVEQIDRRLSHLESMSLRILGILIIAWMTLMLSVWVTK